jgi:choline/ethanolamine phosphotransferase
MFSSTYLSKQQIEALKHHKYSCEGNSLLETYVFQPFWNWLATKVPLWIAPNLITITGLAFNIVTSLWVIASSPQADKHSVPPYVFVLCALGLFIYQTLDAIDGKQARRTNTASPLGELFDHGCDAVSTIFVSTSLACAVSLGTYPPYVFYFFAVLSTYYYVVFWQYYCLGKLIFNVIDVSEALVFSMLMYLVAGVVGPQVFLAPITVFGHTFIFVKVAIIMLGGITINYMLFTMYRIRTRGCRPDINMATPAVPFVIVLAAATFVYAYSSEEVWRTHSCLCMLMFGRTFAKLSCNLIVTTMSKSRIGMLDSIMLGPCALVAFILLKDTLPLGLSEHCFLQMVDFVNVVQFVLFVVGVCNEVARGLNINVFTIPYQQHVDKGN